VVLVTPSVPIYTNAGQVANLLSHRSGDVELLLQKVSPLQAAFTSGRLNQGPISCSLQHVHDALLRGRSTCRQLG
jgi:hypothetical protein